MNTHLLKQNFLLLRQDVDSYGPAAYNETLARLYNASGEQFKRFQGRGNPGLENVFALIPCIATVCSLPHCEPYNFSQEEQRDAIKRIAAMLDFIQKKF